MKLRPKRKKIKMKTRSLLLLGAATLAAITFNTYANDAYLSPRAAGNQIKTVSGTSNDPNLVSIDHYTVTLAPRAAGNQVATVAGTNNDVNAAAACAKSMAGSPRQIQSCVEHTTMPLCNSSNVAAAK